MLAALHLGSVLLVAIAVILLAAAYRKNAKYDVMGVELCLDLLMIVTVCGFIPLTIAWLIWSYATH